MNHIKVLFKDKRIRYLINGTFIFTINITLAYFISLIPFSSNIRIQNNIANVITTELMVFISFFIHNYMTWENTSKQFLSKLVRYHFVMAFSIIIRLLSFALFNFLNFPFLVSTILSILIIIFLNFISFDKFVFNM